MPIIENCACVESLEEKTAGIIYVGKQSYRCPPVEFWKSRPIALFVAKHGDRGKALVHALVAVADDEGRGSLESLIQYLRETSGGRRVQWKRWAPAFTGLQETQFVYVYGAREETWLLPGHALLYRESYIRFSSIPLPLGVGLVNQAGSKLEFLAPYVKRLMIDVAVRAIKTHVKKGYRIPFSDPEDLPIALLARHYPDEWEKAHGAHTMVDTIAKYSKPHAFHYTHTNKGDGPKAAPQFKRRGRKLGE